MTQYNFIKTWLQMHTKTERGASLVEYALLVALIAVACIVAITALGDGISDKFGEVDDALVTTTAAP